MPETVALVLFLLPLAWSPGPGNMLFAANGARFGIAATLPASFGYHAATWLVTAAIGFGLVGVVGASPLLLDAARLGGAAHVLWLGWRIARAGVLQGGAEARPIGAAGGAVLLLLNPKAWLIIALMVAQFLPADAGGAAAVLWITTVFTLNNLVAFTAWTLAGDRLAQAFRSDRAGRRLNAGFGLVLAGVALWILLA